MFYLVGEPKVVQAPISVIDPPVHYLDEAVLVLVRPHDCRPIDHLSEELDVVADERKITQQYAGGNCGR